MSERDGSLLVADMLEAVERILEYTRGLSFENFIADAKTRDAVLRNMIVLGEAARQIPPSYRDRYPSISWDKIARSRHVVVHDYFDVDNEIVWRIVAVHIPQLREELRTIVKQSA